VPVLDVLLAANLIAQALGHTESLAYQPWPTYDEEYLVSDTIKLPIQVGFELCMSKCRVP
jgi:leucyl-tRNA synthetase